MGTWLTVGRRVICPWQSWNQNAGEEVPGEAWLTRPTLCCQPSPLQEEAATQPPTHDSFPKKAISASTQDQLGLGSLLPGTKGKGGQHHSRLTKNPHPQAVLPLPGPTALRLCPPRRWPGPDLTRRGSSDPLDAPGRTGAGVSDPELVIPGTPAHTGTKSPARDPAPRSGHCPRMTRSSERPRGEDAPRNPAQDSRGKGSVCAEGIRGPGMTGGPGEPAETLGKSAQRARGAGRGLARRGACEWASKVTARAPGPIRQLSPWPSSLAVRRRAPRPPALLHSPLHRLPRLPRSDVTTALTRPRCSAVPHAPPRVTPTPAIFLPGGSSLTGAGSP
ncbi:hypothetical protein GHT09_001430 [Marmota monax]|uniref:Uncharacterized protein n=1 Tax=Marmota monax TaxID=9995 RepID=A0A834QYX8_MARMO|nr:hypothetical protein GHT09_001430 [Marmota monax]